MRTNKYKAVRTTVDGITFASKREAKVYAELRLEERAGLISDLELQPEYPITVAGVPICTYRADFRYKRNGEVIVVDAKGVRTPVYRLKKKLVKAVYGVEVREV